ncbi:MAG: hypothetical protein R8G66_11305 [Cytophagales bacterium]|nr:hypothetical protein [Cytophagales bacterium]
MREKIWGNFIRTKYQALYLSHFNSYIRTFDRIANVTVAIASSGTIGAWLIWKEYPIVWASILGASQLTNIIKPFLPYLKDKQTLAESYIFYETLHLDYEKLWSEFETNEDEKMATEKYFQLRDKELQILDKLKSIKVNNNKKVERLARNEWANFLSSNYNVTVED